MKINCYNFEYKFGSNIPHCALYGVCNGKCEWYLKEQKRIKERYNNEKTSYLLQ